MRTLDATETITLTDGDYAFVEKRAGFVRLRSLSSNDYLDLHVAELSRRVAGMPPAMPVAPFDLDNLPDTQREEILTWVGHLEEIITGTHPRRSEGRPEFDPALTTLTQRVERKVHELRIAGIDTSRSNVHRKLALYREHGPTALVDRRSLRQSAPLKHLDPRIHSALVDVIIDMKDKSTGTKTRVIKWTEAELLKRHGAEAPPLPSYPTMVRNINAIAAGRYLTGSARTRRSLGNRPHRTFKKQERILPGAEVQVDSTTMDVLIRTEDGKTTRPVLTIMVDIASRSILSATLRLDATRSIDHVALLAQALVPGPNRPDKTAYRELVQDLNPGANFLSPEERHHLELSRPYVLPRTVVMDNGKDYLGGPFQNALQYYGINTVMSSPHTPTGKAIVERTFGSINTLFAQYLPGYVGRSPEFRGEKVEKDEGILTLEALYELFDDWVLKEWQNRPHSGLIDPHDPRVTLSPNQMLAAAAELTSDIVLPATRDLYIELMPSERRTITATGIELHSRVYDSPELLPLRGTKSKHKGGKWEVKYDPYNSDRVWVRGVDGWIECPRRDIHARREPYRNELRSDVRHKLRSQAAATNAAINGVPLHRQELTAMASPPQDESVTTTVTETLITRFDPTEE